MKLTGIKKAVGEYKSANAGGYYSPRYGYIMLDRSSGEVWTDEFYSMGHNEWKNYDSPAIMNLGKYIAERQDDEIKIDMKTVKEFAEMAIDEYEC